MIWITLLWLKRASSSRGVLTLVAVATFACVCCSISMRAARRIRKISSIPTVTDEEGDLFPPM